MSAAVAGEAVASSAQRPLLKGAKNVATDVEVAIIQRQQRARRESFGFSFLFLLQQHATAAAAAAGGGSLCRSSDRQWLLCIVPHVAV